MWNVLNKQLFISARMNAFRPRNLFCLLCNPHCNMPSIAISHGMVSSAMACEQAPMQVGYRAKRKIARYGGLSKLDFCLRPIPHLGACSQASSDRACYAAFTTRKSHEKSFLKKYHHNNNLFINKRKSFYNIECPANSY